MTSSKRFSRRELILSVILGLFLIATIAGLSYYLGYQQNINTVELMKREQYTKDEQYSRGLDTLQNENAEIATKNVIVCAEYQKLYQAYTQLSDSTLQNTADKYTIPGSARGTIDPCYANMDQ